MNEEIRIADGSSDRKYFTMIPNIVFEYPLTVYAFRVYSHIKKVAGENGVCFQTLRTIAGWCNISHPSVIRAIRELEKAGMIEVTKVTGKRGGFSHNEMTIIDLWQTNVDHFNLPDLDRNEARKKWKEALSKK